MIILSLLSCLHQPLGTSLSTPSIPLYRSSENGTRLFVEVDLGIPGPHYFMIDTGASVSAIRTDIVQEMELGITGGEEDGVDNENANPEDLYTKPEEVETHP